MNFPILTFIVAAYNAESTLQRTLGSLATDVDRDLVEVLIIDDGSTDGTARIADAFCQINRNFRLLKQTNQGLGAVRNRGIQEAMGAHVTFCDADDIFLPPNHLQLVQLMHQESSDIGLGLGFCMVQNRAIGHFFDHTVMRALHQPDTPEARRSLKFLVQPSACTKIFRRRFLGESDIRFSVGRLFEDVEFTTGALLKTDRISVSDLPLFIYDAQRNGAITTDVSARRMEIFDNLEPIIDTANRSRLSGPQSLCLLTGLMRTVLWCLDNVPTELRSAFKQRLLETFVRFRLPVGDADRLLLDSMIKDPGDRRALDAVSAIWLSSLTGEQLMEML